MVLISSFCITLYKSIHKSTMADVQFTLPAHKEVYRILSKASNPELHQIQ